MLHECSGDLLESGCDVLVNPVNCVGVMGAGLALAFKRSYPSMFAAYAEACRRRQVALGAVWVWQNPLGWRHEVVVCLPTKAHWRDGSRVEDIDSGLRSLRRYLDAADPELTVAVPMLGAGLGGLSVEQVAPLIRERLSGAHQAVYLYAPLDVTPPGTT